MEGSTGIRKLPYCLNFYEEWIGRTERVPLNVKTGRFMVAFHLFIALICKLQAPFRETDFLKSK